MQIVITDVAAEKIRAKMTNADGYLKLKYDTEGTGCVMNGVPILWLVETAEEGDELIETDSIPVLVEKSKMVFYDKELKIDFSTQSGMFQLKSPGQTINGRMSLKQQ